MGPGERAHQRNASIGWFEKICFVFFFRDTKDIVIAGPAGEWIIDDEDRWVSVDTKRPILRLDDLVVVLRNAFGSELGTFRCSIDPKRENLARTQEFLAHSNLHPLRPSEAARTRWLDQLRSSMGKQVISISGIDPMTRVARIIVEADYHMKLIGMGILMDVPGYFDLLSSETSPPILEVIRVVRVSVRCDSFDSGS